MRLDDLQDIDELHVVEVPCHRFSPRVHRQQPAMRKGRPPLARITCHSFYVSRPTRDLTDPQTASQLAVLVTASRLPRLRPSAPLPSLAEATAATPAPCPRPGAVPMAVRSLFAA